MQLLLSGSGDITLSGKTTNYECKLSGSGDVSSYELKPSMAMQRVSSGNIEINCSNNLIAIICSGDIEYKGDPKTKDTKLAAPDVYHKK
jgi:DUF4097 and DUF4098 domain-containing protein YvlB